jgi:hypothetical protein
MRRVRNGQMKLEVSYCRVGTLLQRVSEKL